jgi:hypothetical protein
VASIPVLAWRTGLGYIYSASCLGAAAWPGEIRNNDKAFCVLMVVDILLSKGKLALDWRKIAIFTVLLFLAIVLTWVVYLHIPLDTDWSGSYRPATQMILSGQSPYKRWGIFVPPWTFLPLIPFAILPPQLGRAVLFTVSLASFAFVSYRLKSKPIALVAILFSYPVLYSLLYGNLEWLIALGFALPPQIGLFFVLIKPHIGAPIAMFWLFESWRRGGLKEVARVFLPVSLGFLVSFVVFGFWPLLALNSGVIDAPYNSSLWPHSIPLGIALLIAAIRSRKLGLSIVSAPFLSIYIAPQSWSISILGLADDSVIVFAASISTWIVRLLTNQFLM